MQLHSTKLLLSRVITKHVDRAHHVHDLHDRHDHRGHLFSYAYHGRGHHDHHGRHDHCDHVLQIKHPL